MGGVGLVGNLAGGLFGSSAANSAGKLQQQAGDKAAQQQLDTAKTANAQIDQTAHDAAGHLESTAGDAAQNVVDAAGKAGRGVNDATAQANGLLQPYIGAGADATDTLRTGLKAGGDFNRQFSMDDFQNGDPGYQFRLQQAQEALQRSQAARGGALGGGAAKELTEFSQNFASGEFQKAFDRFESNTTDRYNRLAGVSKTGLTASDDAGTNLTGAAKYVGDIGLKGEQIAGGFRTDAARDAGGFLTRATDQEGVNSINAARSAGDFTTGGAAARAGGMVGGANAISSGIAGGINSAAGTIGLSQILRNGGFGGSGFPGGYVSSTTPRR